MGLIRNYLDNVLAAIKADGSATQITATDNSDLNVNVNTLLAGEDQSHGVFRTENQNGYVRIQLSAVADKDIEHSAAGADDLLVAIYFNSDIGEDIIIKDGTVEIFTISTPLKGETWIAPGGGVKAASKWVLKTTTSATDWVICVGNYG